MSKLTHIDKSGRAAMVDVTDKDVTARRAVAEGFVYMSAKTLKLALSGENKKGGVIPISELAGIMGAKQTSALIPLCHPLPLSKVSVSIEPIEGGVRVEAVVKTSGKTGVEMEALTAVSTACLTVYDMLKAAQRDMQIDGIKVLAKSGGKSGNWTA
jgi:cyclic pyranopterin phosphate synthase